MNNKELIINKINEIKSDEVVLLITNKGQSFICSNCVNSLEKVNISNYLVVATDQGAYEYLTSNNYNTVLVQVQLSETNEDFMTPNYRKIVAHKFLFIYYALLSGKSVTYMDNDIVVFRNFYPYFNFIENYDIAIQYCGSTKSYKTDNVEIYACTGFIYIKNNEQSLNFIKNVSDKCLEENQTEMDQECFNYYYESNRSTIKLHYLNPVIFPNRRHTEREGFDYAKKILIHYNYYGSLGEKLNYITQKGFIFDRNTAEAVPYDPVELENETLKMIR